MLSAAASSISSRRLLDFLAPPHCNDEDGYAARARARPARPRRARGATSWKSYGMGRAAVIEGYDFSRDDFARVLVRKHYPERSDAESAIIRDWLIRHLDDYDRVSFSVRVGDGQPPNPDHLPGVQRSTTYSTRKRIDVLAWQGKTPTIVECKQRIGPGTLGQLLGYRQLLMEELPDVEEPRLVAIGRTSDPDTERILSAHGVTVYLYAAPDAA